MIGQKIFFFRKSKGMTQEQLAQGICSISHLSKIENGHEIPSADTLSHLCNRLGIKIHDIDTEKESSEFSELLEEWYVLMVNKERNLALDLFPIIEEKKTAILDPMLLLKYKLYYVRFTLMKYNLAEAESELADLSQYYKTFDPKMKYYYQFFMGALEYGKANYSDALHYFKKAEELSFELYHQDPELFYLIALAHSMLHDVTFSINYASQALEIFRRNFQITRCLDCEVLLGINNRRLNNHQEAERHYLNALKAAKKFNYAEIIYISYHNLGVLYSATDSKKAIHYFLESLKLLENEGLLEKELKYTESCYGLSEEYYRIGNYSQMFQWIERGEQVAMAQEFTSLFLQFKVLRCKANDYSEVEKENLLKGEIIPYFLEKKMWHYVADYAQILADDYYQKNKYKSASQYYQLVIQANRNLIKY